ncbi:MAG TPA: SDR family oxidoreductase [Catalimonadaceae bacterium]|nr:SDR family oxidoreductase [Catalimonadaceae bacterium]
MRQKNVLLIGASSGIGQKLLEMLVADGCKVFTAGRSPVDSAGHVTWDATAMEPFTIPSDWPDVFDGMVYLPGTILLKPFHRLSATDFQHDFQVNVLGFVQCMQAILPRLKKADGSSVVVFSTVAAKIGLGFHASISSAKGALEGLALSLASELAPSKIRVNVVAPSLTDTPLASALLNTPEKLEAAGKRHPLQRVGSVDDMASAARFFLSDGASWITGQCLTVDGGMSKLK